jgi:hypothetical protein
MELTTDQKIADVSAQITTSQKNIVSLKAALVSSQNSLASWTQYWPTNNVAGFAERKSKIEFYTAEIARCNNEIAAEGQHVQLLNATLATLMDQKAVEQNAQQAQTNLINASTKLTPEQLYDLQLEAIKGQNEAATEAAKTKAMTAEQSKTDAEKAAKTKRYLIIGGAVFLVLTIVGIVIYIKTRN